MLEFRKSDAVQYEKGEAPRVTETDREWVAEVVKTEVTTSKDHPDWAPSVRIIFRILEEPFVGAFASGFVPTVWSPERKLDIWLKALGIDVSKSNFPDKFTLEPDQLKRKIARIRVKLSKDGFANVPEIYPMGERDYKRIAPNVAVNRQAPATEPPATTVQAAAPAPAAVAPAVQTTPPPVAAQAPAPQPQQGQVTKDSSIPF